jgi:hypothetical protein
MTLQRGWPHGGAFWHHTRRQPAQTSPRALGLRGGASEGGSYPGGLIFTADLQPHRQAASCRTRPVEGGKNPPNRLGQGRHARARSASAMAGPHGSVAPMTEPSAPLILHGDRAWISPYMFSTFVALREKGLDFEVRRIDLDDGEHNRPPYRDLSLTARVPALTHGDFWVTESNAIVEYLDEAFAAPAFPRLLPAEPRDRARYAPSAPRRPCSSSPHAPP